MNLRVGLVGAGVMGRNHARVIRETGADLAGVVDADAAAAAHVAQRLGSQAHTSPQALLDDPRVDALVVATPTIHHFEVARAALEAGKHLLVEKPITSTAEQAEQLIRLARRKGLVLAVGHVERHNPVVRWVKERLRSGVLGEPVSLQSRRLSPFPERIRDVGVVLDLAIHDLDITCYLSGGAPRGVYAIAGGHRDGLRVEDHASILVDFDNGVDAFTEVSWLTPTKVRTLTVTCGGGVVELDYMAQQVAVSKGRIGNLDPDNLSYIPVEFTVERSSLQKEEPLRNEHLDFQRAIREGTHPLVTGEDGLQALTLAQAALTSAREMRRVPLKGGETA